MQKPEPLAIIIPPLAVAVLMLPAAIYRGGDTPPKGRRYCGPCDEWVTGRECPKCGADTEPMPRERKAS